MTLTPELTNARSRLIEQIHAVQGQFSLAITGGGTSAIAELFSVAGASRTILEANVPYHSAALASYVSATTNQGCNNATGRAMAMTAYQRAMAISTENPVFGLGCTAAIATDRDRRGSDRCHIALQSATSTQTWDLTLDKSGTRAEQESICASLIIAVMAEALGIAQVSQQPDLIMAAHAAPPSWQSLLAGTKQKTSETNPGCIFPGAFNPFHEGHRGMLRVAEEITGEQPALEISIANVDKPPLDYLSMSERGVKDYPVIFTNAPTFLEKSALFPGTTFIVGTDTILRIDQTKYYADLQAKQAAFALMAERGIRFLVFGRDQNDKFVSLSDLSISPALGALCQEVPEHRFRQDISSTQLRNEQAST